MHPALTDSVEDRVHAVVLATGVNTRALIRTLAQGLAYGGVELFVHASLDAGDDVDSLENVEHPVLVVDNGDAADVVVDHEMNNVEDGATHASRGKLGVGTEADIADRLFQQNCVMLVVDGDELEDTILGDDRDHHLLVRFTIHIDEGDSAGAGLEHTTACFEEGSGGVNGDCLYGDGPDGFLNV